MYAQAFRYLDTAYHNDKPRLLPVDRDRQKDREQSELGQDLDRELMDFLEAKPGDDRVRFNQSESCASLYRTLGWKRPE